MIAIQEAPIAKYKKGESVKIVRGGHGVIIDVFILEYDEPKYSVGFQDGIVMTFNERDLLPYTNHDKGKDANNGYVSKVGELKRLWQKDNFRLCSKEDRNVMAWIADYLCEYEILTTSERDELYQYLGVGV